MSESTLVPMLSRDTRSLAVLMTLIVLLSLIYAGCAGNQDRSSYLECRLAGNTPGPGLSEVVFEPTGKKLYLSPEVEITELDVADARVMQGEQAPVVELNFTPDGAVKLAGLTAANIGRRLVMIVEGTVVSAPVIRAEISGGRALIMGQFTLEEATRIADQINLGCRPED